MSRNLRSRPTLGEIAASIGAPSDRLRSIRLAEPRQHALIGAMEELRVSSLARGPEVGCRGLRVIEETGSGKSEAAKKMVALVEGQDERKPGGRPVLHVTLGTLGTPRNAVARV